MSRKKERYIKKMFESTGTNSDISANLYETMLTSSAFKDLSKPQQILYVYCKLQYYSEKKKPFDNRVAFTFSRGKSLKYGLYSLTDRKGLSRDIGALIDHGFLDCMVDGSNARMKNVYRFSDRWQKWGTKNYELLIQYMTKQMRNKRNSHSVES